MRKKSLDFSIASQYISQKCGRILWVVLDLSAQHCVLSLYLPEDSFLVQNVGDEDPAGGSHQVLGEVLGVRLAVGHAPAEGEVLLQHFMADVDQDGVHTWKNRHSGDIYTRLNKYQNT